ncbi:MAG: MASE1 domain-containing protein [Gemmatimonadaceae bacterium]
MSTDPPRTPRLVDYLLVPLLYFLAAKAAVLLTVQPESTAIVWPPNGVLLAALIRFRMQGYLGFAGLTIVAEAIADAPAFTLLESVLFGLVNVAEVTLACAILMRWRFNGRFTAPTDVVKFVVAGPLLAASIAASLAAAVNTFVRGGSASYLEFLRIWWLGDAVGLMIVTPLLLGLWIKPAHAAPSVPTKLTAIDMLVAVTGLGAISLLIAARGGTLLGMHVGPVLLLPFVIFVAVRFGVSGAALAVAAVALVIMILTKQGYSLFGSLTPRGAVVLAQEFIFITSLLALGPAALMSQLRTSQGALVRANAELTARARALERLNQGLQRAEAEVVALNASLEQRVHARTAELETALAQVTRLQQLLPICAWCRKVRDDHDYWQSVEDYIVRHTDTRFSHSICPECTDKLLPESAEKRA